MVLRSNEGGAGGGCGGRTLGFPVKVRGAGSGHEDSLRRRVQRGAGVSGVGCSGGDGGGDGGVLARSLLLRGVRRGGIDLAQVVASP